MGEEGDEMDELDVLKIRVEGTRKSTRSKVPTQFTGYFINTEHIETK